MKTIFKLMDIIIATKIRDTIAAYERDNAAEFAAYTQQKKAIAAMMDNEFAAQEGNHVMERQLFALPEILFNAIRTKLTVEEYDQIWGHDPKCTGAKWFAKTFPQYRTGRKY